MKKIVIAAFGIVLTGMMALCQDLNNTVVSENSNMVILIGECNRDAFAMPEFREWFDAEYASYTPNPASLENLQELDLNSLEIKIVLGTWCPDSRREVPRFLRIVDDLGLQENQISMISVNMEKKVPGMDVSHLGAAYVPTIIVFSNGEEKGRIVEMPETTLEEDLVNILK